MRSENIGCRYHLQCGIKIEFLLHDIETNAFERQKSRVPFVHMKHIRLDAERGERFDATNSEHDLLAHAHLQIAAIELGSDQSILGAVFRNIGVEKIQTHSPNAQFPKFGKDFTIENRHRNQQLRVAATHLADRQMIKALIEVNSFLNPFLVDLLPEIAMAVEQTDPNEI